ncbi:MAG: ArsA family ATPase [Gemmatimonadaceae bacterium]
MSALDGLLDSLPAWILVGGKGGVGKTTCAAALAARSAARGSRTLLLSTDPARALPDALGEPVGSEPAPVSGRSSLFAMQLDAATAREAFLSRWRPTLLSLLDRGTYLDADDIAGLVDAALPGADEAMALLTLLDLERDGAWARVIVDTAPTGHTLRLLELPAGFQNLLALLEAMQEKHRFMVRALTRRYRPDEADHFLREMAEKLRLLRATLHSPARCAMVLVTRAELVVTAETTRYADALARLEIAPGALVINAWRAPTGEAGSTLAELETVWPAAPRYHAPLLSDPPIGLPGIDAWGRALRAGVPQATRTTRRTLAPVMRAEGSALPRVASLSIVAGKGGVGKTTVACALAVHEAREGRPVLIVSTDPAPSVADALDQPVGEQRTLVRDAPGLFAQQLDAAAAFVRFREAYAARVDAVFDGLLGGLDAAADRRIVRDLLALAPPGIDELYALAALGEAVGAAEYAAVIVDPAPTGHLLRLLEMPALALEWSHRLMRLMLKYRELGGLGDAAEMLLAFSRRTRALQALLRDPARACALLVALDEPLVRAETARLLREIHARGVDVAAVVWNRSARAPCPLPTTVPVDQFQAAVRDPPPRGVAALREWLADWELLARRE